MILLLTKRHPESHENDSINVVAISNYLECLDEPLFQITELRGNT